MTKRARQDWVDQARRLFIAAGPSAVSVENVAKHLGVTKGGFYGYFGGRAELVAAVLDQWEEQVTTQVQRIAEEQESDPGRRTILMKRLTWDGELGELDTVLRAWAAHDPGVAERVDRVDRFRIRYLRKVMREISVDDREADLRAALAFAASLGLRSPGMVTDELAQGSRDAVALLTTPGTLDLTRLGRG